MAQRGALFFAVFLLAACGGHVGSDSSSNADTGTPDAGDDAPHPSGGWASYTMRITSSTRTWMSGAPSVPGDPTSGWSGRFDFDPGSGSGSIARAVMLPPFAIGTELQASSGATILFTAPKDDALLRVSGPVGFQNVSDAYDTFSVQISSDGSPITGTLTGRTMASSGDVAWSGTVTATVAFERDAIGPTWRWGGATPFAPVTLPWDVRTIESSEPYEETLTIDRMIAGSTSPGAVVPDTITSPAHGTTLQRGAKLTLLDWNLSDGLAANEALVHDFEGNATTLTHSDPKIPGVAVARRGVPTWAPADGGAPAFTWGAASVVEADCASCAPQMMLGPVHAYCAPGSEAGLAIRLPASGPYLVRLSVHAEPPAGIPTTESPPGVSNFLHVQLVNPGRAPADVDLSAVKWPAGPAPDGSYDTGSIDVFASPAGAFPETGVAISGGGLGTTNTCFPGPLIPATWTATISVEHIVQAPPP